MKQYCRYCVNLVTGYGKRYCRAKGKFFAENTCKTLNKCSSFEYCEIDAFYENLSPYKPRKARLKNDRLFEEALSNVKS